MTKAKFAIFASLYVVCFIYLGGWVGKLSTSVLDIWPQSQSPQPQEWDELEDTPENQSLSANGSRILVMSSVGRSGSSFLGELLTQQPNTFYLFEPLHYLQQSLPRKTEEGVTAEGSRQVLEDLYRCRISYDWMSFASVRTSALGGFLVRANCDGQSIAEYAECVSDLCQKSCHKVFKVIRMRVSWVEEMLQEADFSLKVIHIVRDPRASFASLGRLRMVQKNYSEWCPLIQEDLERVHLMEELYPRSFLSIKYEDLCYDPPGTAIRLWRFLAETNSAQLPVTWKVYLKKHTSKSTGGAFNTERDSRQEAENWRAEINEEVLTSVERDCAKVLDILGYNLFGSRENVRNMSIPLKRQEARSNAES